jgi:hypothetical protein
MLDPRFKMDYYGSPGEETYQCHLLFIEKAWEEYKPSFNFSQPPNKNTAGLKFLSSKRKRIDVSDELKRYVASATVDVDTDVLGWWKANTAEYPNLSRMARDILSIPATSATSERCFSRGRINMPFSRTRLAAEAMRAICCLQNWLGIEREDDD